MNKKRRGRFASHLWKYRNRMGYSQSDVAEILGFSNSSQICQWEKGARVPSLENIFKLSILYRAPVIFLFLPWYKAIREEIRAKEEKWRIKTGYYQKIKNKQQAL